MLFRPSVLLLLLPRSPTSPSRVRTLPVPLTLGGTTIKDLPIEVLLLIVSHIPRKDLGLLAQVDRDFNSFLSRQLWTSIKIDLFVDPGSTYTTFTRFLQFATRDPLRAQNLRELTLIMKPGRYRSTRHSIGQVAKALQLLPNLQQLQIEYEEYDPNISKMLCHPPGDQPWPFKLHTFSYEFKYSEEILPFLSQQPSIEVCNLLPVFTYARIRSPRLDKELQDVILPNIRQVACSWEWVNIVFLGRALLSLEFDVTPDLLKKAEQVSDPIQPGTTTAEQLQVYITRDTNLLHLLPRVIQHEVGVRLHGIRTLVLEAYSAPTQFLANTLTECSSFSGLEELHWYWFCPELGDHRLDKIAKLCAARNQNLQLIEFGAFGKTARARDRRRVWKRDRKNDLFREV
ncbi:hypothetical protein DL93DRAFT_2228916 [Clavulina sp. PMI_390]|nr:hypothetical protein DL93DRAFT_2228916 [Clavulina sp. PMI_390]